MDRDKDRGTRDKALDNALAQIEKQFGKGSVMKMGDDVAQKVAAIPTGALSLDLALGIGGLPRGRVVEIYGPESSGKCHPAGTYVWTDHGLETIAELFERVGDRTVVDTRVTDVSAFGIRIVNEEAQLESLGGITHNGMKAIRRITVDSGRHVEATDNHPLRVLNERGRIVWKTVGDLKEGDVLVSALFGAETAVGGDHLVRGRSRAAGVPRCRRAVSARSPVGRVAFTNAHDADVQAEYAQPPRARCSVSRLTA